MYEVARLQQPISAAEAAAALLKLVQVSEMLAGSTCSQTCGCALQGGVAAAGVDWVTELESAIVMLIHRQLAGNLHAAMYHRMEIAAFQLPTCQQLQVCHTIQGAASLEGRPGGPKEKHQVLCRLQQFI